MRDDEEKAKLSWFHIAWGGVELLFRDYNHVCKDKINVQSFEQKINKNVSRKGYFCQFFFPACKVTAIKYKKIDRPVV